MASIFDVPGFTGGTKKKPSPKRQAFRKARAPFKKVVPLYGGGSTLAGTPLTRSQKAQRQKIRTKEAKKHKRQIKRIYRRLI